MDSPKVLVVDDEKIIRQLLSRTLETKGYYVETVDDGEIALKKTKGSFFNLLITDLKMPKTGGIDVLKEIKKVNPYIEVIVITGYPAIESAIEAIKIGAFDYICKPFDVQKVNSTVKKCLERQKFNINRIELSELMILSEISKAVVSANSLDSLLSQILDFALGIVKARKGSFLLLDEQAKELRIKVARGLSKEVVNNTRIKSGEGIYGRVIKEKKPLLVTDISQYPEFQGKDKSRYETKSFLSIPLISKSLYSEENVLGVINIADKLSGKHFTEREQTLLSILAEQAAAAIENYKLYSRLQDKIGALKRLIKELDETQNQLIQSEKMAAVGQLAFGIAHEIRNPLGIILGGVEFLKNSIVSEGEIMRESVEKIKHSIERANNIVVDLLRFARTSKLESQQTDVCKIMNEIVSLIKNQAYVVNVRIKTNYPEKGIFIKADSAMLRQALFNLCINAVDAMSQGGELSLNVHSEQDSGVIIEVADTGKGIPESVLSKIFNPFFTTKDPGKGTGLGLSIVYLILKRHKGTIDVKSKVSEGTRFIIRLPKESSPDSPSNMVPGSYGITQRRR